MLEGAGMIGGTRRRHGLADGGDCHRHMAKVDATMADATVFDISVYTMASHSRG